MWRPTVMGFEQAYAAAGKVKHGSYYAMQDMTSEICSNVTASSEQSTATLIDTRDNNTYTIAKLLDGKCWMTQNLRLVGKKIISSDDSDVSADFTVPSSSSAWDQYDMSYTPRIYMGNGQNGHYYTWTAANAGSGNSSNINTDQEMKSSICAKGWKLPSKQDIIKLVSLYNYETAQKQPANFDKNGGGCSKNDIETPRNVGSRGDWWTSNGDTDRRMGVPYGLSLYNNDFRGGADAMFCYFSAYRFIRCVER